MIDTIEFYLNHMGYKYEFGHFIQHVLEVLSEPYGI